MIRIPGGLVVVAAVGATGCYTTTNVATLSPLDTAYPVSASSQYVSGSGEIVDDSSYGVARSFEFEKTVSGARHESTETPLVVTSELDRLLASSNGDAIVNLKLQATRYDTGSHGSAASWKTLGWTFGLSGGALMLAGAAVDNERSPAVITAGAVVAGAGALSFLLAAVTKEPASWHFKVSGQVVRSKSSVPTAPTPSAAPSSVQTVPSTAPSVAPAPPAASPASKASF